MFPWSAFGILLDSAVLKKRRNGKIPSACTFFFFFYPSAHLKALCKECSRSAVRRRTRSEDAVRIQRLPELSWKPGVVQDTLFAPHLLRVTLYL